MKTEDWVSIWKSPSNDVATNVLALAVRSCKQNKNTTANAKLPFHCYSNIKQCKVNKELEQIVAVLKTRASVAFWRLTTLAY